MYGDSSWLDTAGRLLIVACFLGNGVCNLAPARIRGHIERMGALGTPVPAATHWIGMAMLFGGSALVLADWHADIGAWCLIVFTVAATAIFHRFWNMQDPAKRNSSRITVLANTAIVGGLLLLLGNML